MANENNKWQEYKLPYDNAAIDAFLTIANNARAQAMEAAASCSEAMTQNENTTIGVIPAFPQMKDSFASGVAYSTRSLLLSAEAAYQAQSSVCKTLKKAGTTAEHQLKTLQNKLREVEDEIAELEKEAVKLRTSFAAVADKKSSTGNNSLAAQEAKKLLACMENIYSKHELVKTINGRIKKAGDNISYLNKQMEEAADYQAELEDLLTRAQAEWDRITELFALDPTTIAPKLFYPKSDQQENTAAEENQLPEPAEAEKDEEKKEEQAHRSAWTIIWDYIKVIILAVLLALLLRAYVLDITHVEGSSMYPTLTDNDNLITLKVLYLFDEPQRGDIVVLHAPDSPGEDYIKRIIAIPGDELEISDGNVYINGVLQEESYITGITTGTLHTYIEDGYYFVMGDNRENSRDSRASSVGLISRDDIVSKAVLRIYPFRSFGTLK